MNLPATLPEFVVAKHYRQLHPTREGRRRYRFVSMRHVRVNCHGLVNRDSVIQFRDARGHVWMTLDKFGILIAENYAWNGCSPKRWVWPFGWCGTPDFACTILASLVHDALYQFSATAHFPLDREHCDAIFREIIDLHGEDEIADIYHGAVRKFGSWSARPKNGEFSTLS